MRIGLWVCCVMVLGILTQCDRQTEDRFIRTYRDILIIRELYPDTAVANPKVREILRQNGFTREEFRRVYIEMAKDPERFRRLIDSLRRYAHQYVRSMQDTAR